MPQAKEIAKMTAEVLLEPRVEGNCAVFIIEARNRQEIREVKELFGNLDNEMEIRQLAEGTITAYAVRLTGKDLSILSDIELTLKENYRFSISERSFSKTIYNVVCDVSEASGSVLRPMPECGICATPDPFPTTITFADTQGRSLAEGCYCARCVAAQAAQSDLELMARLLSADQTGLAALGRLKLVDKSPGSQVVHEFRVEAEELRIAAAG